MLKNRPQHSVTSVRSKSSTGAVYYRPIKKVRTHEEIAELKKELNIDDHLISLEDLVARYGTDIDAGLSMKRAGELFLSNGPNCLIPTATKPRWMVLLGFLFGGFNIILWACSLLTFIGYGLAYKNNPSTSKDSLYFGVVLVIVTTFTGFFGFYQEHTTYTIIEGFKKMIPQYANVIRSGQKLTIPSDEVVIGDVVEIKAGDMVPADLRIIQAHGLKVDNSCLTGESIPVSRGSDCTDDNPLETKNLVFYSTAVVEGRGTGIVVQCGEDTVIGRIAGLASGIEKQESLMQKEIRNFVKILTIFSFVLALLFFIISLCIGYDFYRSLTFFIAILVANVPEGLPVTLTASMTLTAKRMARKNCLVKKLEAIESLGSCNVICSDKTGTLTQNIMTASHFYYDDKEFDVLTNLEEIDYENEAFTALCQVAILCSTASFLERNPDIPIQNWKCAGDASESAILKIMERLRQNVEEERIKYPKLFEIPFNSSNKFQVSIHLLQSQRCLLVIKGAPEKILERCEFILHDGETKDLDQNALKSVKRAINHFGQKGERILAFADHLLPSSFDSSFPFNSEKINFPLHGLRFIGMISLVDPPRDSVPLAVEKCKSAGIRVIMVTGDHPITAAAVAKKVGIISHQTCSLHDFLGKNEDSSVFFPSVSDSTLVITGNELREMSNETLEHFLSSYNEIVFARTSPQQKMKIVEALQRLNLVVAVTGDGVNDSPALKKADIGIAMGITGSDVSKEAADMILLDDNFATIVTGIEEGRLIFENLKKSITFVLTSNVPEIVPFLVMILLDIPEALSVMAILVINIGTDLWPAISLAYEDAESDTMNRKPRNPDKDRLVNIKLFYFAYGQIGLMQACGSMATYFFIMARHGFFFDQLIGLRYFWEDKEAIFQDSYGQNWTYEERLILSYKCYAGYFLSILITQIADLLRCKTRRLSFFRQGMTNSVLNAAIMFGIILASLVVYCPGLNSALQFEPIDVVSIFPAIPYAFAIFAYDEVRKYFIRFYPSGFFAKETYF